MCAAPSAVSLPDPIISVPESRTASAPVWLGAGRMNAGAALVPVSETWAAVRRLALDAVASPLTRAMYAKALDDFFFWWEGQGRPPFARATVQAHRVWLEQRGYSPSTINQRLAAIRKLAREAALNGVLAPDVAAGIGQVPGASPGK